MDAFLWWVETLVVFPAGLVGVCFGGVGEGWLVGVDSRELAELCPGPVCIVVAEVLDVAVTVGDIETRFGLMSHHDT